MPTEPKTAQDNTPYNLEAVKRLVSKINANPLIQMAIRQALDRGAAQQSGEGAGINRPGEGQERVVREGGQASQGRDEERQPQLQQAQPKGKPGLNEGASTKSLRKQGMMVPSPKSNSKLSSQPDFRISQERFEHLMFDLDLDENGVSRKYPFVPPEVWGTPMTDEEFKDFVADLEEAKARLERELSTKLK